MREEAAIRDAEWRRVSMATQPGEPPGAGELGLMEGREQSEWKAPGER